MPHILPTGQPMELRRIYGGDILQYHSRLYYFLCHTHRASTNDYILRMAGFHDGQETIARAPNLLTLFRVCTNVSYTEALVRQLDTPKGLPGGARYRIILEGNGSKKEQMYVFSDGGESEFQFYRARKVVAEGGNVGKASKDALILYLMKLDQHPDVMYVMGWRRTKNCQLTKVDGVARTPKYHSGRERDLMVGTYCVRNYLGNERKVLEAAEEGMVKLGDGDKHRKCQACGHKLV